MIAKPIQVSHDFLDQILTEESILVDATMGNGNDTLYFAPKVAKVFAFDVQEEAIQRTAEKLAKVNLENVQLILSGHENLDKYITQVDAAIFNLGYLPSADKSIITHAETTIQAIEKLLKALTIGGRIAIMVYYGHDGGREEKEALIDFLSDLPQDQVTVMSYQALNQKNCPPFLLMVEKLAELKN